MCVIKNIARVRTARTTFGAPVSGRKNPVPGGNTLAACERKAASVPGSGAKQTDDQFFPPLS
jgi:hypothetical protein